MSNRFINREFTNYRDIVQIDKNKIALLFMSVTDMDTNELRNIATMHQLPLGVVDELGDTLIHKVISNDTVEKNENNRLNIIKFLVSNNVNPDSPNKDNITPLHLACLKQYPTIIEYLLEIKVNPNFKDNLGNTPFHYYLNGQIKPYKPVYINDLIQDNCTYKTEAGDVSMNKIESAIWADISDNSGIKAIHKTIIKSFVTTDELGNVISDYYTKTNDSNSVDDLKKYKDVLAPLYNKIQTIISGKWGEFRKIDNIKIDYNNKTIIKDFTSVKDKCQENINSSIDSIISEINKINVEEKDPDDYYIYNKRDITDKYVNVNAIDHNDDIFHNKNLENSNIDKLPACIDSADNYINYDNKLFIGGARTINIDYDITEDIRLYFEANNEDNIFSQVCLNNICRNDECTHLSKYISKELYNITVPDYDYTKINDVDEKIIYRNTDIVQENNLSPIAGIYNLMMNTTQNPSISDSRLDVQLPIYALYYVAGSINNTYDKRLSLTQSMKTSLIHIIYRQTSDPIKRLTYWIYILFSTDSFDILYTYVTAIQDNSIPTFTNNNKASVLANFCYQIFTNPDAPIIESLKTEIKKITGNVEYINKREWLIYAMTKVYDSMQQKPIENHIIDTIFIIRKTQEKKEIVYINNIINIYLKNLDLIYQHDDTTRVLVSETPDIYNIMTKIIINNDFTGSDERQIYGDKFKWVYNLENNILPSRRFIYLQISSITDDTDGKEIDYLLKKFTESYLLGLNFISCFPKVNHPNLSLSIDDSNEDNRTYKIFNNSFEFQINRKVIPFLGFIGNNTDIPNNTRDMFISDIEKDYFDVNINNEKSEYRPSSRYGITQLFDDMNINIYELFNTVIGVNQNIKLKLTDVLESYKTRTTSNNLTKLVPIIYPILLNLNSILTELTNIKVTKMLNLTNVIDTFVKEINSINSNYFINYYLNTKTENVTIPSFFYYKIPTDKSQEKSIIFDDSYNSLELLDDYTNLNNSANEFVISEEGVEMTNYKALLKDQSDFGIMSITPFNNSYIKSILNKEKYIKSNTIKKYMKISKRAKLPPSLEFNEFYKMMVLDLIQKDVVSDIDISDMIKGRNKLFKIDGNNEELGYKFTKAQITEIVISRYFKWLIDNTVSKILKKFMNIPENDLYNVSHIFKDTPFVLSLSKIPSDYPKFDRNPNPSQFLSFYRINEKEEIQSDDFILYSNDYTSNTLNKIFYKFILDKDIMINMLKNNAHTYLTNNENKTAIYSVLRNYYYPIFTKINTEISYNFTKNIGTNIEYPTKYILDELKNHSSKLLNDKSNNSDILKSFSFNQYNQIKVLITSDPEFGNNILRNSELSYSIVGYMTNMYLSRTIFYDPTNIDSILETNSITDPSLNNFPFSDARQNINQNDFANVLKEVKDDLQKSKHIIETDIDKLEKNKKSRNIPINIRNQFDVDINRLNDNRIEINRQIKLVNVQIHTRGVSKKIKKNSSSESDIIKYYDSFINNNNDNRGSYMMLWDAYLNQPNEYADESMNFILLNTTKRINNDISNVSFRTINSDNINDMYKNGRFYHTCSKYIEPYFKQEKFLENNDTLDFVNNLLIHMTQNVICFGFEVAIKKCLFNYFFNKHKGENMDVTINRVGVMFNQSMRKDGEDMLTILYNSIANKLVLNSVKLFKNKKEQVIYSEVSTREILSEYINLFTLDGALKDNSYVYKNLNVIVNYFDKIATKMIYNWQVTIENYFRFVINQSRIIKTLLALHK
jgi:hypothetical protein|uniref:Uncharacterized protein n=1 Tax=viral metagenome TaxID=1070528 RepID=A0A6C0IUJ8_9ZZZZ